MRSSLQLAVALTLIVSSGAAQELLLDFTGPAVLTPGAQLEAHIYGDAAASVEGGTAYVILSFAPGITAMYGPGGPFYLPVQGTIIPVGTAPFGGGKGQAPVTIPNSPGLAGLDAWLAAVVLRPAGAPLVSYSVPFGPIIEDSIQ